MARPDFPRTLAEFQDRFAAEEDCRRYLVACRWPDGFRCPRCGEPDAHALAGRELLQCRSCRRQTSVTAGTALHRTHVPLRLWFAAAYLVATHTPGFSAVQLQRQLGLGRYETAWTMLHKLRRAMLRPERDRLSGVVEVDEAYVGGVEAGRSSGRRRDSSKSIVVAAVEVRGRGSGRIRLAVVEDLSAAALVPFVEAAVAPGSAVLTDGWQGYAPLRRGYDHQPSTVGDPKNASVLLPRVHRTFRT
jgi:transposase-like protein